MRKDELEEAMRVGRRKELRKEGNVIKKRRKNDRKTETKERKKEAKKKRVQRKYRIHEEYHT